MTDISRARRRRPGYAWLAVGPVAAAGAIAIFIAVQPAGASTTPTGPVTVGNLSGLGTDGGLSGLSGLGAVGNVGGLNGIADTGNGTGPGTKHHHRHGSGDDCGCMTPTTPPTMPTTPPTMPTTPPPPPPGPAPVPTPVGNTFPVTG